MVTRKKSAKKKKVDEKVASPDIEEVTTTGGEVDPEAPTDSSPKDVTTDAALEACNGQTILETRGDARGFALVLSNGHTLHVKAERPMTFQLE